jgi:hypothetical protein
MFKSTEINDDILKNQKFFRKKFFVLLVDLNFVQTLNQFLEKYC